LLATIGIVGIEPQRPVDVPDRFVVRLPLLSIGGMTAERFCQPALTTQSAGIAKILGG
jgi:hypothetical protein